MERDKKKVIGGSNLFRPEVMFSRNRDALARQVDIPIELQDFIDWPALASNEKLASAGMVLTLATAVSNHFADSHVWLDPALAVARIVGNSSFRRLIIPGIVIAGTSSSLISTAGETNAMASR